MTFNPGLHAGISSEEYHGMKDVVSKSGLDKLAISPKHYQAYLNSEFKETPDMLLGRMIHMAVLEPQLWSESHVVLPELNMRTNDGKAQYAQIAQRAAGRFLVKPEQLATVNAVTESVRSHKAAGTILGKPGTFEASAFAYHEQSGEKVKCRPDFMTGGYAIDLKTTRSAAPDEFSRSCANFRYHVQAAFYLDVLKLAAQQGEAFDYPEEFVFIAVEKEPPYGVAVYVLDVEDVGLGRALYERDLDTLARARATKTWVGYPEQVVRLSLPAWARAKGVDE